MPEDIKPEESVKAQTIVEKPAVFIPQIQIDPAKPPTVPSTSASNVSAASNNEPSPVVPVVVGSATPLTTGASAIIDAEPEPQRPDELTMLKSRAQLMGISFSNNIGLDALKQKIDEKLNGTTKAPEPELKVEPDEDEPEVQEANTKKPLTLRESLYQENMKLVRVRITNMDPKKKDLPGEIITVANRYIGSVPKFVPYGDVTENGYHIPYVIYKMLKKRKFLNIKVRKNSQGKEIVETNYVPEFALEVLPALTERDLARLAASQAASNSLD